MGLLRLQGEGCLLARQRYGGKAGEQASPSGLEKHVGARTYMTVRVGVRVGVRVRVRVRVRVHVG